MANDLNYELLPSTEIDLTNDEPSSNIENDIAELELNIDSSEGKNSKQTNRRNFLAKKKIEQLQEERLLKKLEDNYLEDNYYDDWD